MRCKQLTMEMLLLKYEFHQQKNHKNIKSYEPTVFLKLCKS